MGFFVGLFRVDCEMVVLIVRVDFVFILFFKTTFFLLKYGWSALHIAVWKGFEQIVKILVGHGSNVDLQDPVLIFSFLYLLLWVHSLLGCFMLIVNGWVVLIFILFLFFLNNFLFVKGWMDRSSLCC